MADKTIPELEEILNSITAHFSDVTSKKMFGCYAQWTNENVFALVWKTGRIGLKIPDQKDYETLMKEEGAEPWKAGPMQMAHWILIPKTFHTKPATIKKWALKAHEQCSKLEKKIKKTAAVKKKTVLKKAKIPIKKGKK